MGGKCGSCFNLDPLITNLDMKYPVSIMLSLTHSKKCRKQMVKSGALLHLEKLVAMGFRLNIKKNGGVRVFN
ncbi:hypothetical protein Hanom_Chr03g00195221 [Helianthus anomalus]